MEYNFNEIEKKWQKYWEENNTFHTDVWDFSKPKYYVLDMFPYPSGVGLHAGHVEGYTATDIVSRMKRMQGYNVLHPMGYDSFGLPAEQYAVQTGNHPNGFTEKNIEYFNRLIDEDMILRSVSGDTACKYPEGITANELYEAYLEDIKYQNINNVTKKVTNGDIFLFHDGNEKYKNTISAIDVIIPQLQNKGYKWVTVSTLINEK